MKKILMRFIYWILMEEAKITVNTTCFGPYYQGKIDKQLDILKKYNVHAAFFMTGEWVEKYPDEVKAIYAAGHDLGNHSENHKNMSRLSDEEKTEEIMRAHQRVKELTGVEMNLFRPPYGDY